MGGCGNGRPKGLEILGFRVGYCPHPVTVYIGGVPLRAIYNHNIVIIQLLLRGGSTEGLGFRVGFRDQGL